MDLKVLKLHSEAILPKKGNRFAAAFDIYTLHDTVLKTNKPTKIQTGIAVEIPDGYFGLLKDRSSLGSKGIITLGGVIDSDYRGELIVCQVLSSTFFKGWVPDKETHPSEYYEATHEYFKGDRIAQLLILPVPELNVVEVPILSTTERNVQGFGSTGK